MSTKKAVFRFVLALGWAVVGLVVLFGLLGGAQEQVHAAAPQAVTNPVGGQNVPRVSPRLEPSLDPVHAPMDAPLAARLYNGVGASSVITVCKPSAGSCDYSSVQAAVNAAITGDIIKVAQGVYNDEHAIDGHTQVVYITQSLTIQGGYTTTGVTGWTIPDVDGHPTILDGEGQNDVRVVYVAANGVAPILSGFHIRNGRATQGAGIYIENGDPVVERSRIYGNVASNFGGGVYIAGGSPLLVNDIIYSNTTTTQGGGVYVDSSGSPAIHYSTLFDNRATSASSGQGGGIYLASGSPVISASIIVSNVAGSSGGGIFKQVSVPEQIKYNDVFGNTPDDFGGFAERPGENINQDPSFVGPVVGVDLSEVNFRLRAGSACIGRDDPDYPDNIHYPANDYDGLARPFGPYPDIGAHEFYYTGTCFAQVDSGQVYTTVQDAVTAFDIGEDSVLKVAGLCTGSGANVVTLTKDLTLRGGYTLTDWSNSDPNLYTTILDGEGARRVIEVGDVDVMIEGFYIYNGHTNAQGGGIYLNDGSNSTIRENLIYSNSTNSSGSPGGGICIWGGAHTVQNNQVYSNVTQGIGGGVYVYGNKRSDVVMEDNQIHHNYATSDGGGVGVQNYNGGNQGVATIRNNEIYANSTLTSGSGHRGGGIYCAEKSLNTGNVCVIQSNVIYSNTALSGGGIRNEGNRSVATIEDNEIYGNWAMGAGGGGGIYAKGVVTVQRNIIFDNRATDSNADGGGIYAQTGTPQQMIIVAGNSIYNNMAQDRGGGVYLDSSDFNVVARNNLIYANMASSTRGGGCATNGDVLLENSTLYDNRATGGTNAGGIYGSGAGIIRNNIVVSNTGYGIQGGDLVPDYNNVWDNTGSQDCYLGGPDCDGKGTGNTMVDPLFVDASLPVPDFSLQASSPCRDAVLTTTHAVYDYDNYARPFGAYADKGAHEYYTGTCFARLSTGGRVYDTVQAAVLTATAGVDDVQVAGVCEESDGMVTIDKALALRGGYVISNWIESTSSTILDAQGQGRVITITSAGNMAATIGELIVRGGNGAGIYVATSLSPTIQNVIAYNNTGAGFDLASGGSPRLYNNTFVDNGGGGISLSGSGSPIVSNTIVVSNTGDGIAAGGGSSPILAYNDVWGNDTNYDGVGVGTTDISENPHFVSWTGDDFYLQPDSACVHAGDPKTGVAVDFEGDARPDGDETVQNQRYDIGADEAVEYFGVTLGPDGLGQPAVPGSVVEYTHFLTNTGTHDDDFVITNTLDVSAGDAGDWNVTYVPDYTLLADEATEVLVVVDVPPFGQVQSGTLATIIMTATYQVGGEYFFDVTSSTIRVQNNWGLGLSPATQQQTVDPGQVLTYTHVLTNYGTTDSFTLTLSSSLEWAEIVLTDQVEGLPGGGAKVNDLGGEQSVPIDIRVSVPIWASDDAVEETFMEATSAGAALAGDLLQAAVTDTTRINHIYSDRYVATESDGGNDFGALNSCQISDYPCQSIRQALDQANGGEKIRVSGGVYQEFNLPIYKAVELMGGYDAATDNWTTPAPDVYATTINAGELGYVFYIAGDPIVEGFTLQNGKSTGNGGGVRIAGGEPILRHNIISGNVAARGGGVYHANVVGNPVLDGNVLWGNTAGDGGGFYDDGGGSRVWNNIFRHNDATNGGGFYNADGSPWVWHNTFVGNAADYGGGLYLAGGSPVVSNTIIFSNTARQVNGGGGVYYQAGGASLDYNDVGGNVNGDCVGISAGANSVVTNPLFVNAAADDYHLLKASPCRDIGDGVSPGMPETDMDGQPRTMNGTPDIGADEYQKTDVALVSLNAMQIGSEGEWLTYTHVLTNTGNYYDSFDLTWQSAMTDGWMVTVNGFVTQPISAPMLAKNATTTVEVLIRVPTDILSGTVNETVVTATSQLDPEVADDAVNTTIVRRDVDVSLYPDRVGWTPLGGSVGGFVIYTHTLVNEGNYTDTFDLSIGGSGGVDWVDTLLSPSPVTLAMGASAVVTVRVDVPNGAAEVEVHTTLVTATTGSGAFAVVTDTTVAKRALSMELAPDSAGSDYTGEYVDHQHTLTNSGNYTDTYVLTYTSELGWPVEFIPPSPIEVGAWPGTPGSWSQEVTVRVTIPDPPTAFGGQVETMVITATSVDTPTMFSGVTDVTTATQREGVELWPNYSNRMYQDEKETKEEKFVRRVMVTTPAQLVTFTHTLRNNQTSNSTDTFTLTHSITPIIWDDSVVPTQTGEMVWLGEITTVLAALTVPVQAPSCLAPAPVATLRVTATSWFSPTGLNGQDWVVDKAIVNQCVDAGWSASGTRSGPQQYPAPGANGTVIYTHTLTNDGNYTDSFTLSSWSSWGLGGSFGGVDSKQRTPDIGAGMSQVITVEVTVPYTRCGATGSAIVTATSRTAPEGTYDHVPAVRVADTIIIDPAYFVGLSDALTWRYVASTTVAITKTYTHWLTNTGNCDNTFDLGVQGAFTPTLELAHVGPLSSSLEADNYDQLITVTITLPKQTTLVTGTVEITAAGEIGKGGFSIVTDTIIVNQSVDVALEPNLTKTITAPYGVTAFYTHTLTNEGDYQDAFEITWWNDDGWDVWVCRRTGNQCPWVKQTDQWASPKSIDTGLVGPGETAQVEVLAFVGDVYTWTNRTWITATSLTPEDMEEVAVYSPTATAVDTVLVRRPHVTIDPDELTEDVTPGTLHVYTHTLDNTGGLTDSYTITCVSLHRSWLDDWGPKTVENLSPGQTHEITVAVTVPSGAEPGWYDDVVVTATSWMVYTPTVSDVATDTTNVLYILDAELSLEASLYADPGETVTFTHRLTNTGNYSESFDLLTNQEFSIVTIEPSTTPLLQPLQSILVTVTVRIPLFAPGNKVERVEIDVKGIHRVTEQQVSVETVEDVVNINPVPGTRFVAPTGTDANNNCNMQEGKEACRTVQHAVNQAVHGDTVKVSGGTYQDTQDPPASQVVLLTKSITLIGGYDDATNDWDTSQPDDRQTILDAEGQRRVMVIETGITPTIEGFYLQQGYVDGDDGAGLYITEGATPTVRLNHIRENTAADGYGGGVYYGGGDNPILERNKIYNNTTSGGSGRGAGIYLRGGWAQIWSNLIYHNTTDGLGGGLYSASGTPQIWHNTLYSNTASVFGGGGLYASAGTVYISNTIIAENAGSGVYMGASAEYNLAYNDVWGNSPSNYVGVDAGAYDTDISENPRFADALGDDLRLTFNSPCINAGDPNSSLLPDKDYEGNNWGLFGRHDMGAYEYGITSTKTVAQFAQPNTIITYTIRVTNTGRVGHTIRVTDTLHRFLDSTGVLTYTFGDGEYLVSSDLISWTGYVSGNNTVANIAFTAHVTDGVAYYTPITNVAWVDQGRTAVVTTTVMPVLGTRYVAETGSDTDNDCRLSPCGTIQHAVSQAQDGDEVKIADGTYADGIVLVGNPIFLTGGYPPSPNDPIVPGEWDENDYDPSVNLTMLDGSTGEPRVVISGSNVSLVGFRVVNGTDGISVTNAGGLTLHQSWVYDNVNGVRVQSGTYMMVNNVVARNTGVGLLAGGASTGIVIHDTFADNAGGGAVIYGAVHITNTIFSTHTKALDVAGAGSAELWNTLWWGGGTYTTGNTIEHDSIISSPLFINSTSMDYHILEESAAVDNGLLLPGVTVDVDNRPRPVRDWPDIGADEFPLGLEKYGPETADPGQMITYTIELKAVDDDLLITDVLPIYVTFTSPTNTLTCSAPSCGIDEATQVITWAGDSAGTVLITYTGYLEPWLGQDEVITNSAWLLRQGRVDESVACETTINQVSGPRYVATSGLDKAADGTDNNCLVDSQPCATVQWAVDQAMDGDEIKVTSGWYTSTASQVVLVNKAVTLTGGCVMPGWTCDPEMSLTYLNGQVSRRVMHIVGTTGPVVVDGFHLLNGYVNNVNGGGVRIDGTVGNAVTVTLTRNRIYSNTANTANGGGLYLRYANATLTGNRIYNNATTGLGGGVNAWVTDLGMINNVIADNQAGSYGDGLFLDGSTSSPISMRHNTIADNGEQGLYVYGSVAVEMTNTVVAGHTQYGVINGSSSGGSVTVEHTLWYNNSVANTSGAVTDNNPVTPGDPLFVDPSVWNYHILPGSAAFDVGVDAGVDSDIDGEQRLMGLGYDVGADELRVSLSVVKEAYPSTVEPGDNLTYTLYVTNTGLLTLTADIVDTLPSQVTPSDQISWLSVGINPGETWMETIPVTANLGVSGFITNEVQVTTDEGAAGISTAIVLVTDMPDITVEPRVLTATLNVGGTTNRTLTIGNVGSVDLNWNLVETVPWLSGLPTSGAVVPLDTTDVVVTFNATGLTEGVYSTTLQVNSNDLNEPQVDVAVELTVEGGATIYLPLVLRNY